MADFFQNGVITTLQKLGDRTLEDMESELEEYATRHNMVLLIWLHLLGHRNDKISRS